MSEKENEENKETANFAEENTDKVEATNVEEKAEETVAEEEKEPTPEEQYAALNDKYIRLYSDFDNFRKRTIKEKADIISTANSILMGDLIGTLDDFERAIDRKSVV